MHNIFSNNKKESIITKNIKKVNILSNPNSYRTPNKKESTNSNQIEDKKINAQNTIESNINIIKEQVKNVHFEIITIKLDSQKELEDKSILYVSNIMKNIFKKFDYESDLSIKNNKMIAQTYTSNFLMNMCCTFKKEDKIENELKLDHTKIKMISTSFLQNVLLNINNHLIQYTSSDLYEKNNNIPCKQAEVKNDTIKENQNKDYYSNNIKTKIYSKNQNSEKLDSNKNQEKINPKNKKTIIQQNIIIKNTNIDTSPTIIAKHSKKNESNKNSDEFKKEYSTQPNIYQKSSITKEILPDFGKKVILNQQLKPSAPIKNKELILEENKDKLENLKMNLEKLNVLTSSVDQRRKSNYGHQINQQLIVKETQKERDNIYNSHGGKAIERLNKSKSKHKELSIIKPKNSIFQSKIENLSNLIENNNKTEINNMIIRNQENISEVKFPSGSNTFSNFNEENNDGDSILESTINKRTTKITVAKKTKINFF